MVVRDVPDGEHTRRLLEAAQAELRQLAGNLLRVREEERRCLARELHDELGQRLLALKLDLAHLSQSLGDPVARSSLGAADRHLSELVDAVRRLSTDLRPAVLDDLGLEALAQDFERNTGIRSSFRADLGQFLPEPVAIAAYRFVQEALTNIARHAGAQALGIHLQAQADVLEARVSDDGRGMDPGASSRPGALGLAGMRERARHLGGTLSIQSAPGHGTRLVMRLPLPAKEQHMEDQEP